MGDFDDLQVQDRKIIVGIDFGTTFSGISWAETKRPDRRTHINQWPISSFNNEGASSEKVPTVLHYSQDEMLWGFQVNADIPVHEKIEWFKLGLNPDSRATFFQNMSGRDVDALVTDYFSALNKHVMFTLEQKLGSNVLRTTPLEFVLTVPAIWTESAKQKTLNACKNAGLTTKEPITLVSEPEAAAIYALHGLDPHGLQIGDTFVICDAGGGTVDLISYTITNLRPILEIEEAAAGSGGVCGSTSLNRQFRSFLKEKLDFEMEWEDEILAEACDHFDSVVKKQFSMQDSAQQTYNIPVPGMSDNPTLGVRRGKFALQNRDLHKIFEPVVTEILNLVMEQIKFTKTKVKAVLLVGGFGASVYLKDRLRSTVDESIEVMQPPNAWLAVVNGAVMKGLANASDRLNVVSVMSRTARKHYGVEISVPYVKDLHNSIKDKRYFEERTGVMKVDTMQWFNKKGDKVVEKEPFLQGYFEHWLVSDGPPKSISLTILCDRKSNPAPLWKTKNVVELVELTADLRKISPHDMKQTLGKDEKLYYEFDFQIEAVYLSASTTYTLIHKGVRYDTVTAEYV